MRVRPYGLMVPLKVQLSEETERKFRETAMKRFGYSKGALSLAAERALSEWVGKESMRDKASEEIGDPVDAIEGLLKHVKTSSVHLQHKASRIRSRRATTHATRRR